MKDDEEVPSETQMQKISLEEGDGGDGGGGSSAKKTKTRFTQVQKEKMMELGQTLGWRIQNHNEAAIKQFCDETSVKRHAFKGWLYNTKYALARDVSSGSSTKKRTTKFTEEQKDKMLEFGQRLGWRIKKHNEADVQQFCDETGVKLQTFRVWMYNTKHALTRAAYSGCGGSSWKKKFSRTKFTKEQKDKMREFGERLGWRILKKDMAVVEQFCEETAGVKPHSLMFWVKNKRHTHGYKSQEGRPDSQSKINEVETRKRHLEAETNRCSEESKFRETMTCHELSVDLENKKMECIAVQDEYRDGMKEWINCLDYQKVISETAKEKRAHERITNLCITRLKEDKKVICEREKRVQERIAYSEEESGKTGSDDIEKYVLLKTENIDLECSKRRVGDEIEAHKKMFCDLETRVFRMEEENSTLRCMESQLCGNIELELRGLQNEVSHNDESEIRVKDRDKMSKLQAKITTTGTNSSQMAHLQTKEKMLHTNEQIQASAFPDSPSINMLCEPSIDVEEKEKNTPLESKVEFRYNVRKQQVLELDGSSNQRQSVLEPSSVRPASDVHTIEISDSDDSLERSRDSENDLTSKKCLKRICLGQRDEGYGSSCKKDFPFMLIQKPKRASRIVSSDSESKEDVEEQQDKVPKRSPSNLCSETCNVSCRGKNVEKMNGWAERTSQNERTSPNHLETSGMAYNKVGKSAEDGKERKNRVEEVGSDSDGRSLSGIILEGSGSLDTDSVDSFSDSEDSEDFQSALDKAFAMILRRKDKELKWKFEVDMLYSFEEDPVLCMKAVCALYRQQTSQEKPRENFLQYNNRGFDKFDALRGTTLAEFLMDGDRKGDLKKSVKELEMFDPKALEECKRLARHYSEQLFTIYQNKEDPFFLPSSTGC